jgi:hypothetical protein
VFLCSGAEGGLARRKALTVEFGCRSMSDMAIVAKNEQQFSSRLPTNSEGQPIAALLDVSNCGGRHSGR